MRDEAIQPILKLATSSCSVLRVCGVADENNPCYEAREGMDDGHEDEETDETDEGEVQWFCDSTPKSSYVSLICGIRFFGVHLRRSGYLWSYYFQLTDCLNFYAQRSSSKSKKFELP